MESKICMDEYSKQLIKIEESQLTYMRKHKEYIDYHFSYELLSIIIINFNEILKLASISEHQPINFEIKTLIKILKSLLINQLEFTYFMIYLKKVTFNDLNTNLEDYFIIIALGAKVILL